MINLKVLQHSFDQRMMLDRELTEAAKTPVKVQEAHEWRLRASSLPGCSILWLTRRMAYDPKSPIPVSLDFYGSVGTSVHTVFQRLAATSGNVFGDWLCLNPDCKRHKKLRVRSFKHLCPTCKEPCLYEEISIKYKSMTGHIDCVYRNPKTGVWSVHDYKTIGLRSKDYKSRENLVSPGYVAQGFVYAWALREQHDIPIKHFGLMNIARDNWLMRDEYIMDWTPNKHKATGLFIEQQIVGYDTAMAVYESKDFSLKNIRKVIKVRTCQTLEDYQNIVEPCMTYEGGCQYAQLCMAKKLTGLEQRLMEELNG